MPRRAVAQSLGPPPLDPHGGGRLRPDDPRFEFLVRSRSL